MHVEDKGNPKKSSADYNITFNLIPNPTPQGFLLPTITEATVFENSSTDDVIAVINTTQPADNFTIVYELPSSGHFKIDNNVSGIFSSFAQSLY